MAQMPAYRSRYGDTITDLLARRGDIAAQGHLQSGAIWGNAVQNVGNIAATAIGDYAQVQQQKEQERQARARDRAIAEAFSSEAVNNPRELYKRLLQSTDPITAMKLSSGWAELNKLSAIKNDPEKALASLPTIAGAFEVLPEHMKKDAWSGMLRPALISSGVAKAEGLMEEYDPTKGSEYIQFAKSLKPQAPVKPVQEVVETVGPDGRPVKKLVGEDALRAGVPVYQKPEKEPVDVEGRMVRAEERREARAIEAEQRKAEAVAAKAAETEKAAAKETNTQVASAFAAMDAALKEVERLSGTKAVTSPLESANARQQYEAAASAFAATLSRATGDSRISDLDRKAYAGLLAYAGPGSTLLNITRPDLARKRFTEAKKFFTEAAKARAGEPAASGVLPGGTEDDPLGIRQ